jgi:hypothetical protein
MGLVLVLTVDISMRHVRVFECGVVVQVLVHRTEVLDDGGRPARRVVSHVEVFVYVGQRSVGMALKLLLGHGGAILVPLVFPSRMRSVDQGNAGPNLTGRPTGPMNAAKWAPL